MIDLETFSGLDEARKLDTTGPETGYLVTGPSGTTIRLSASAYHLLRAVRSGIGWQVLAERVSQQRGQAVSATEIEASYRQTLERLATLESQRGEQVTSPGFWFRRPMLTGETVTRIARQLSFLFTPGAALALLGLIAGTVGHALVREPGALFSSGTFWPAYALFVLSLIAHELGHATACFHFGARPADIGFTVYWIFPAFYSDVTAAWQLERRQRVVVDLGGVFFQLAVGTGYWLLHLATGWRALEAAVLMILCGCLFSLNPFFKLDGYWVLADALGVTDLSRQPARLWRHAVARWRGRTPAPLPWPRWVCGALAIYTPLVVLFWCGFLARLAPALWQRAATYPSLLTGIVRDLVGAGSLATSDLSRLLASTFFLFVAGLMIRQLMTRLKAAFDQRQSRLSGQHRKAAAAG